MFLKRMCVRATIIVDTFVAVNAENEYSTAVYTRANCMLMSIFVFDSLFVSLTCVCVCVCK